MRWKNPTHAVHTDKEGASWNIQGTEGFGIEVDGDR